MLEGLVADSKSLFHALRGSQEGIASWGIFLVFMGFLAVLIPKTRPLIAAVSLILPLRFLMEFSINFDESDYEKFSPIISNLANYRFTLLASLFAVLPIFSTFFGSGWEGLGSFSWLAATASIFVLGWPEGFYEKNIHFGRWHPLERVALIGSGILSIIHPSFILLFLLFRKVITYQFEYPEFGSFHNTHADLPHTILFVVGSLASISFIIDVEPYIAAFLILAGFSAHYFHSGIAKLEFGALYYIVRNNPKFLFSQAYKCGWLSFLREKTVLDVLKVSDKTKPIVNIFILVFELGMIFLIFSPNFAVILCLMAAFLHLSVFLLSGVFFWRWLIVDASILAGFILFVGEFSTLFSGWFWMTLFVIFVLSASRWMRPKTLGWLDSPYSERFEFEAELRNGDSVNIDPNVFRPYHDRICHGITGSFGFLTENRKIIFSFGVLHDIDFHKEFLGSIHSSPSKESLTNFVEKKGEIRYDEEKFNSFKKFLKEYLSTLKDDSSQSIRHISGPCEYYTTGLSDRKSRKILSEIKNLNIYRVDGIWTKEGFDELRRHKVLSLEI